MKLLGKIIRCIQEIMGNLQKENNRLQKSQNQLSAAGLQSSFASELTDLQIAINSVKIEICKALLIRKRP